MRRLLILILVFAAATYACGSDSASIQSPTGAGQICAADIECGPGALCMGNACVLRGFVDLTAHIEIRPPVNAHYVRRQLLEQQLGDIDGRLISLPIPVAFDYSIHDDVGDEVAARLHLVGVERIPGRTLDVLQGYVPGESSRFRVEPGAYDVRVVPTAAERPGLAIEGLVVRPSDTPILKEFRIPETRRRIVGSVRQRTASNIPVPGIRVRATSVPSGLPSSSAVTLADGNFAIALPETTDTTFAIIAEVDGATAPAWRYEQVIQVFTDDTERTVSIPFEMTTGAMRTQAMIRVIGFGEDKPEPVAAAAVTFTASTAPETKTFRVDAVTDAEGFVVVETDTGSEPLMLLAAKYDVTVDPPAGSRMARTVTQIDLTGATPTLQPDLQVEVAARVRVTGEVSSASGQRAPSVQVHFERADSTASRITAITDQDGTYATWLDPGQHLVRVDPTGATPIGEGLAGGYRMIDVPAERAVALPALSLPAPVAFQGTVVGASNEPLAKTSVEIFVEAQDRVISIARSTTDELGIFRMVVPAGDGALLNSNN